jgi:hypothetical protein
MPMPTFLVIGAAKAGTTALYEYLGAHPEVYVSPNKEPRFFAYEGATLDPSHPVHKTTVVDIDAYRALFDGVTTEKAIGEVSPSYLHHAGAPARIRHHVPDAKLIAILRDPAERAYSHFLHHVRQGVETTTDFEDALHNRDALRIGEWYPRQAHISFGFYHEQLTRMLEVFPREQILVILHHEFRKHEKEALKELYRFIGVADSFEPQVDRVVNRSGIPRSRALEFVLTRANWVRSAARCFVPRRFRATLTHQLRKANLRKPPLSEAARRELVEIYRDDILKLQELLGKDLSRWLA